MYRIQIFIALPASFTSVFSAEALGFVRRVRPGEAQDVEDNLQSMATRNFLWTAVSKADLDEDHVEKNFLPDFKAMIIPIFYSLAHRVFQPWLWLDWTFFYLTATGREILRRTAKVDAFCKDIFAAQRAKLNQKRYWNGKDVSFLVLTVVLLCAAGRWKARHSTVASKNIDMSFILTKGIAKPSQCLRLLPL